MKSSTRDRLVLPILIPVLGLVFIALLVVGFSRVLLSVSATAATVTATVVALGIMLIAARVAALKRIRASSLASMLGAVAGVAMVAGGIALAAIGPEEPEKPEEEPVVVAIAAGPNAAALGFDQDTLSFPAGEPVELEFDNQDPSVPHNVGVYADEDFADPVSVPDGEITGPAQTTYRIEPLEEGTYFFRCEVHPTTMTGTIEVAPGGGGGAAISVIAKDIQFDTDEIELQPNTETALTFDNQDGVPHNLAIYADDSLSENLFTFQPFPGVGAQEFTIPGLDPGNYYFQCDVHPNMNGAVVVSRGGGGGGSSPTPTETETSSPSPPADGGGGGSSSVSIFAEAIRFSESALSLPADTASTIEFDNRDAGVPHNVAIYRDESLDEVLFRGDIITGPVKVDYDVPALPAGTYYFQCDVHPPMSGTVTVG